MSDAIAQPCPLCGEEGFDAIKRFPDGVVVGKCIECDLLYTPRRHPDPASLLSAATSDLLRFQYGPIVHGTKRHFREKNFAEYLDIVGRHLSPESHPALLDIGCAHGFFGRVATERGYQVTGVEPSSAMASFAADTLGLEIIKGRIVDVDLGERWWDVICCTDAAEYFADPLVELGKAVKHLRHGGLLFIKVPNGAYFAMRQCLEERLRISRAGAEPFSPSQRVVHYTTKTLSRLVTTLGLDVLALKNCTPTHSPPWKSIVGIHLEIEPPWYLGMPQRLMRRGLNAVGTLERRLLRGNNHFSPSIYVLGRKP